MRNDYIIVMMTCASKKEAEKIIDSLLRKKLIACANVAERSESKFWWNGKMCKARECTVTLKTSRSNFRNIEKIIKEIHSYTVPEIIAIPIICGSKAYLDWIGNSIRRDMSCKKR